MYLCNNREINKILQRENIQRKADLSAEIVVDMTIIYSLSIFFGNREEQFPPLTVVIDPHTSKANNFSNPSQAKRTRPFLENVLLQARQQVRSEPASWKYHECTADPGCLLQMIVTDLCEKITRRRCNAGPGEVCCTQFSNDRVNSLFDHCLSTPIMGNQVIFLFLLFLNVIEVDEKLTFGYSIRNQMNDVQSICI